MGGQWYSMSSRNIIFCVTVSLITCFLIISPVLSIYAQSTSSEIAQWFIPLDLGKELKIKCDGSLVDFVSDCTSPANCKSLRQAGNDILECVPDSKFKSTDKQVPITTVKGFLAQLIYVSILSFSLLLYSNLFLDAFGHLNRYWVALNGALLSHLPVP